MGYNIEVYKVPKGQKHAGFFSFRINGEETHLYASEESAITRRVSTLLNGPPPGQVQLRAIRGKAPKVNGQKGVAAPEGGVDPYSLPTAEERIKAFMSRGRIMELRKGEKPNKGKRKKK
jgi:hypothetical protein